MRGRGDEPGGPRPATLRVPRAALAASSALGLALAAAFAATHRAALSAYLAAREARRAVAAGRSDEAAGPVDRWLRAAPDSPEAHFLKARVAYVAGRVDEASLHLDRAQWLGYPERPAARLRALIWVRTGRYAEAEPALAYRLGKSAGRDPEADEALSRVLLETYRLDAAAWVLTRWARDAPGDARPYLWMTEVDRRLHGDKPGQMEGHFREALRRDPGLSGARLGLAEALEARNQPEEAAREFALHVAGNPDDPAGHSGLGRLALGRGDPAEAARHFDRALAVAPDDPTALKGRARVDALLGDDPAAVARLTRAARIDPLDDEALYRRSLALNRLGRAREAEADARELGRLRREQAEVLKVRDRLMADPRSNEVRHDLARWMFEHGRDEEGLRWVRHILSEEPGHPGANRLLAGYYARKGDPGRANYYRLIATPNRQE